MLTGIGFLAEYVTDEVSSRTFLRMFLASPPRTLSLTVVSTLLIVTHASNTFDLSKTGFASEWEWTEEHDCLLDGIIWTVSRRASKHDTLLRAFASVIRCLTQCHRSVYHMSKRCHGLSLVMLTNISILLLAISQKWANNQVIDDPPSGQLSPSCNENQSYASVLVSVLQSTLINEPPIRSLAVVRALGLSEETMKKLVCTSMQSRKSTRSR